MEIKKFLSEYSDFIKSFCYIGGKFLISAPTGSGKTYTFLNIGKEIIKESNSEYIFVFTTPTRVQSEQNGVNYDVFTVVSGVNDFKAFKVNSVVYDKLNLLLEHRQIFKDKKLILVVDEAHELIYSNKYRKKALENIQELSKIAYTVIHTSATPKALRYVFNYDEVVNFEKNTTDLNKNNIKLVFDNNPDKVLTDFILKNLESSKKSIVNINDKNSISYLSEILKSIFKNKKISLFTSENKEDKDFKYLVENNKLPDDVDLALCTNILNAGINIKNKDVELIYYAGNGKINLDHIQQFLGRTRQEKTKLTIITKRIKEEYRTTKINQLDEIHTEWVKILNKRQEKFLELYEKTLNTFKEMGLDMNLEEFEKFFKSVRHEEGRDALNSCFQFCEANLIKIDTVKLIEMAINKHDSQILKLKSNDEIIKILSKSLNANIELIENFYIENGDELADLLKKQEQSKKQQTKELKNKIHEVFISLDDEDKNKFVELIEMKIKKEDKNIVDTFRCTLKDELKDLYDEINSHHNLMDKFRQMYRINREINPNCIKHYISSKFNNNVLMSIRYKFFNKMFKDLDSMNNQDIRFLGQDYLIIRKTLDKHVQKNISYKQLTFLYNALQSPSKQVKTFKEISPTNMEKFLFKISSIFNVIFTSGRYFISSLIK